MRRLKTFESFKQGNLWREISSVDYHKIYNKPKESFTEVEIDTIQKLAADLEEEGNDKPKEWSIDEGNYIYY